MTNYRYVFLGLSITSSWGNGHATTYRALLRALASRGHEVLFLERDVPYYASNRDLPCPSFGRIELYGSLEELRDRCAGAVRAADLVVVGSYVPEGAKVIDWMLDEARGKTAFYDIDTPVTLTQLDAGEDAYLRRAQIPRFDLYLSFTGGPTLEILERRFGARRTRPLDCSIDPEAHAPVAEGAAESPRWDLGYLGTYSADRQPVLERLLVEPARRWPQGRFTVAGPKYPGAIAWPANVERAEHVPPGDHRAFYAAQRFALNVTRRDMAVAGHSPSVRLFEAAACGTPLISDAWPGLEAFFVPGREILLASSTADVLRVVCALPEAERVAIGQRARARVLSAHTAAHRAESLERYTDGLFASSRGASDWRC